MEAPASWFVQCEGLEDGYGIDRAGRRVVQLQRRDDQKELPAVEPCASIAQRLVVCPINEPHAHRRDADSVDGAGHHALILRQPVVGGIASQDSHVALLHPGQQCAVWAGLHAGLVVPAVLTLVPAVAGADTQDVTGFYLNALLGFCLFQVLRVR